MFTDQPSASRPHLNQKPKTRHMIKLNRNITTASGQRHPVKQELGDTTHQTDTYANWYKNVYVPQAKGEAPKPK